jgi:hypothetical protein
MATESHTRAAANGQREDKTAGSALKRASAAATSDDDDDDTNVRSRVRGAFDEVSQSLDVKGRLERNPYGTLAAAVGIGYLLGGGFFTPLTGRLLGMGLKLGVRLAVLPLINEVASIVSEAIGGESSDSGGSPRRRSRNTGREG